MTLTETLRRGLLARGYTRTETRSGRECYSKRHVLQKGPDAGKPVTLFIWLGTSGSLRGHTENVFTKARALTDRERQIFLNAGTPLAQSNAMLKELEA